MHPALRHFYYSSSRGGYSEEYQAVLDSGIGTAPSSSVKTKDNTCINSLKEAGIWDLLDVFYMLHTDGNSAFATINWKNSAAHRITFPVAPTFTANQGFKGNRTSMYGNLNWIPNTHGVNYTLNEAGYGVYLREAASGTTDVVEIGSRTAANSAASFFQSAVASTTGSYGSNLNASNTTFTEATRTGFFHVKRTASGAEALFKNGASVSTSIKAALAMPTNSFFLLALNQAGTPLAFSDAQVSVVWAGASLHGKESDFNTIISTRLA